LQRREELSFNETDYDDIADGERGLLELQWSNSTMIQVMHTWATYVFCTQWALSKEETRAPQNRGIRKDLSRTTHIV
jgi:hypothetical protein